MSSAAITKYKLMILALLDRSESPLTNTQLSDFFLENGYTNYFTLQETLNALSDSGLLRLEQTYHNMLYDITPAGQESLGFFANKLSEGILNDISDYLQSHAIQIRHETDIYASFDKTIDHEYAVRCRLKEKGIPRLDFTITVPKRETAEAICENWKSKNEEIFNYLRDELIQ